MSTRERLLNKIEAFIARVDLSESSFGVLVARDPSLINKMRRGRSIGIDMVDRIEAFMRDYRPVEKKATEYHAA